MYKQPIILSYLRARKKSGCDGVPRFGTVARIAGCKLKTKTHAHVIESRHRRIAECRKVDPV